MDDPSPASQNLSHRTTGGKFFNPWPGARQQGFRDFLKWTLTERRHRLLSAGTTGVAPARVTPGFPTPRAAPDDLVITWVGHTSFLVQLGGVNILLDPVWGRRASPVSFAGPERLSPPGIDFGALPPVDLVVISHDHYDHLDLPTVRRLVRDHPGVRWVAPLGAGAWLRRRGAAVAAELDWWQTARAGGIELGCTPAQHFAGRSLHGRDRTLWCGWAIRSGKRAVFFAGDTGRHPEFGTIARRFGPFDAALLPIGAYEPRWFMRPVHMDPVEAVDAYVDIARANGGRPCTFVATHWGTFQLADEPSDEPPRLTRGAWRRTGLAGDLLWLPRHGETREIPRAPVRPAAVGA